MSERDGATAPRRGQGVVQSATYSAELLAALAMANGAKSAATTDIFATEAAASPRTIVGLTWQSSNGSRASGTCSSRRQSVSTDRASVLGRASFESERRASFESDDFRRCSADQLARGSLESCGSGPHPPEWPLEAASAETLHALSTLREDSCFPIQRGAADALASVPPSSSQPSAAVSRQGSPDIVSSRCSPSLSAGTSLRDHSRSVSCAGEPAAAAAAAVAQQQRCKPRRGQGVVSSQRMSPHVLAALIDWRAASGSAVRAPPPPAHHSSPDSSGDESAAREQRALHSAGSYRSAGSHAEAATASASCNSPAADTTVQLPQQRAESARKALTGKPARHSLSAKALAPKLSDGCGSSLAVSASGASSAACISDSIAMDVQSSCGASSDEPSGGSVASSDVEHRQLPRIRTVRSHRVSFDALPPRRSPGLRASPRDATGGYPNDHAVHVDDWRNPASAGAAPPASAQRLDRQSSSEGTEGGSPVVSAFAAKAEPAGKGPAQQRLPPTGARAQDLQRGRLPAMCGLSFAMLWQRFVTDGHAQRAWPWAVLLGTSLAAVAWRAMPARASVWRGQ